MATAHVQGTLPAPNPGVVSSLVTIVETNAGGTVLPSVNFTVVAPTLTFDFGAGVGSTINATQVDMNASGLQSAPTVTPPFVVNSPVLPPPSGPINFVVLGVGP